MPLLRILASFLLLAATCRADVTPPPTGTFSGEGLTLSLAREGNAYTGTATLSGTTFNLKGTFDPAKGLRGTFTSGSDTFEWSATVSGKTLTFTTGGSDYKLPIPGGDNPLAKKPAANPLKKSDDKPTPDGALKFSRFAIKDPGINNIEAISFLIPEGWTPKGEIKWFPDLSILANLQMTITDSKSGAQIQYLPIQNFTWMDHWVVPMQEGTNYMGNIVHRPLLDAPEFIKAMFMPQALPHLQQARQVSTEDMPKIAALVSQNWGGTAQVKAAKTRYEFDHNGQAWEEEIYLVLVASTDQGITIWTDSSAYTFRAPKGELDKLTPLMTTIVTTARISQDWYGGYMYVQQLFMNRMNQGIKNAAAISATITKNSEEIRQMFSDSYRQRQDSQDRISRGYSEYIRGVETYTNPYESRPVQLPTGYQGAWVNAQGEYLMSTQSGFDPNVGSTVEWRRMETAH
jgi:hypothetical protein